MMVFGLLSAPSSLRSREDMSAYAESRSRRVEVVADEVECPNGHTLAEVRTLAAVDPASGERDVLGTLLACPVCDDGSWKFRNNMPTARRRRAVQATAVV